ncbi:TraU family protein [Bdellovibrionota bacterium FG-2]
MKKLFLCLLPLVTLIPSGAAAFPNVCTVVKTPEFRSCLDFKVGSCMCGFPVPRPCAHFSYYVPETFVEAMPNPKETYFSSLPGTATQLSTLTGGKTPYGAESDDDTQSFHAHVLQVPLTTIPFSLLPCSISPVDLTCFEGMSEQLGQLWNTGSADQWQPGYLAWSLSPKACMLKGAATSITGEPDPSAYPAPHACSVPMSFMARFPPSTHSACNGWGTFYPRYGSYNGSSPTIGALMIASRMKSLATEVFHANPSYVDEKWQMITPQSSSCFKEGQNIGALETIKGVRETGRFASGKMKGYLFTNWRQVTCCRDLPLVPEAYIAIETLNSVCQGAGDL